MAPRQSALPLTYRVFFLIIEPIFALVGAYYAHFRQDEYLRMTTHDDHHHATDSPVPVPLGTSIVMSQLANLYLLFALNEALVLRCTGDLTVWKVVLLVLLVADFGHLLSVGGHESSMSIYWDFTRWNAIDWGNIPFVYLGASMRIAFLCDVGLSASKGVTTKPRSKTK